jgi:hypothetical protein
MTGNAAYWGDEMNPITDAFLECLDAARAETEPFPHWLLSGALTDAACDAILDMPIAAPAIELYDGTREGNNQTRTYFNDELCARYQVCRDVVAAFKDDRTIGEIERTCGIDLSAGHLRMPHTDIRVKLFTMLIYLSKEPELADAGTDIYDEKLDYVKTAPFGPNKGLIFIPGDDTWHGFMKRPIRGIRRSLIVNYVTDDWRERWQLA